MFTVDVKQQYNNNNIFLSESLSKEKECKLLKMEELENGKNERKHEHAKSDCFNGENRKNKGNLTHGKVIAKMGKNECKHEHGKSDC